jgi:6-phosphogluconolactonase
MNPPGAPHLLFIGTYTTGASRGIYALRLDPASGDLAAPVVAAETSHPSFLALSPDRRFLYAIRDSEARVASFEVRDGALSLLPAAPAPKAVAGCHLAVDRTGRTLLVCNYHAGTVAALPLAADGRPGPGQVIHHEGRGPHPKRQEAAHVHSAAISPDNRFALVCDLGLDRIYTYQLDAAQARLAPGRPPFTANAAASGPRHSAFSPDGRRFYASHELDNTVTAYDYVAASGALVLRQAVSTLPAGFVGESSAAEVALRPDGRFLYVSNRGHDSLAVFAVDGATGLLSPVEFAPAGGRNPRHFALSPDGAWLVCAHQGSSSIGVFRVDPATGRLSPVGNPVTVPDPVCVRFYG